MQKISFANHHQPHARAIGSFWVHDQESHAADIVGNHEMFNVELLQSVLKPNSNFLDIGGYEGMFSVIAAGIIKTGKIFTFEPTPDSHEIIQENFKLHNITNATLYNAAMSDVSRSDNQIIWRKGAQCASSIFINPKDNNAHNVTAVQSFTLDELAGTVLKDIPVTLMKVDIEGAEVELLRGAKNFFKLNPQCLVTLELHCMYIRPRLGQEGVNAFIDRLEMDFEIMDLGYSPVTTKRLDEISQTGGANLLFEAEMKLTIAVTNFNRAWYLDRSITLIGKQTFPKDDFDLVIVDDGFTDQTDAVVRHHASIGTVNNMKYVKRTVPRMKFGNCSIARNLGITCGEGALILFTDPEVMPMPDWAQKHYLAHCGELSMTSGRRELALKTNDIPDINAMKTDRYVLGKCLLTRSVHVINNVMYSPLAKNFFYDFDWTDIVGTWNELNRRINKCPVTKKQIENEFFIYQFSQAGISASRTLLNKMRGFEEDFSNAALGLDMWAGEDAWFMRCADKIGLGMVQESSARAVHVIHEEIKHNCVQPSVAHKKAKDNPDLFESNLGREWGQLASNGFERVF